MGSTPTVVNTFFGVFLPSLFFLAVFYQNASPPSFMYIRSQDRLVSTVCSHSSTLKHIQGPESSMQSSVSNLLLLQQSTSQLVRVSFLCCSVLVQSYSVYLPLSASVLYHLRALPSFSARSNLQHVQSWKERSSARETDCNTARGSR